MRLIITTGLGDTMDFEVANQFSYKTVLRLDAATHHTHLSSYHAHNIHSNSDSNPNSTFSLLDGGQKVLWC